MQPKKQEKESIVKREAEPESETSLANRRREEIQSDKTEEKQVQAPLPCLRFMIKN